MDARLDWRDLLLLAALPFVAVMLVCAATPLDALPRANPDVLLYFRDAANLAAGQLPYRDFPFEYPPLAIVPMALPYLVRPFGPPTLLEYQWFWAFQNALLASCVGIMVGWIAARRDLGLSPARVLLTWAAVAVIEAPLIAWRFDISAVALSMLAIVLLLDRRPGWAGLVLALGALVKIFPVALLPVMLAWQLARGERAGAARLVAAFAATAGGLMVLVAAAVGPDAAWSFVTYQADRLVQLESVASSVLLVAHLAIGAPVTLVYGFQSLQVSGPGTDAFLALEWPMIGAGVALVSLVAFVRLHSEARRLGRPGLPALVGFLFAVTAVLLATNKVFSAQYLLWLLPLGCLLPRRQATLMIVLAVLSIAVFPLGYAELARFEPQAVLVLAGRSGLLVGLVAWALARYRPLVAADRATPVGDAPFVAR
jgi:uncharacterized membrane protein